MRRFSKYIAGTPGYFREGEEEQFPWNLTDRSVWYALLVLESGKLERYGFTSSKSNKDQLCAALQELLTSDEATLLGIWTGEWSTHLFILDIKIAIEKLSALSVKAPPPPPPITTSLKPKVKRLRGN